MTDPETPNAISQQLMRDFERGVRAVVREALTDKNLDGTMRKAITPAEFFLQRVADRKELLVRIALDRPDNSGLVGMYLRVVGGIAFYHGLHVVSSAAHPDRNLEGSAKSFSRWMGVRGYPSGLQVMLKKNAPG